MAPNLLKTYTVPIDIASFIDLCWFNAQFYETFLVDKLHDIGVNIGPWTDHASGSDKKCIKTRNVQCFHPSKISFPGLPSHAEVRLLFLSASILLIFFRYVV
jgi:hypothetical protein